MGVQVTEYEYLQLAFDYGESVASSALNFATVVFAYVIAAHLAGNKLSKGFAFFITLSYSLFLLGPAFGIYARIDQMGRIAAQYRIAYPDGVFFRISVPRFLLLFLSFVPPLVAWCGSIVYMHWHVRKGA
jgi:hypothetical protein